MSQGQLINTFQDARLPAVVCATGTANLALTTLTAAGGTTGVSFDGCTGTVNAAGGTLNSTAGASNPVVNVINSSGTSAVNFTYGGSINKTTSGAAVNIVGLTTPGAATFNGSVTGTNASSGVVITMLVASGSAVWRASLAMPSRPGQGSS